MGNTLSFEEVQRRLKENNDNWELIEFNGSTKPAIVKCKHCGMILDIIFYDLIRSDRPHKKCVCQGGNYKWNTLSFAKAVKSISPQIIVLEDQEWPGIRNKIKCKCLECNHEWTAVGYSLLNKQGCPVCARKKINESKIKTLEECQQKLDERNIEFEIIKYNGSAADCESSIFKCKHCGGYRKSTFNNFMQSQPQCSCQKKISKGERIIANLLSELNIAFETQATRYINNHKHYYDFYIPSLNIYIEYDGEQHKKPVSRFGGEQEFYKRQKRDAEKDMWCYYEKADLIRIDSKSRALIKNIIQQMLTVKV